MPNITVDRLHPYSYTLYGLHVHSDEPLPLLRAPWQPAPALTLEWIARPAYLKGDETTSQYASPYVDHTGEPLLQIHRLARPDGIRYWLRCWMGSFWGDCLLRADGRLIQAIMNGDAPRRELLPMLLGICISLSLRLQGLTCLHASAVLIDGGVIAFSGPSGTGKSTTMTALLRQGARFFSDDLVPLALEPASTRVYPGYPRIGLVPDAAAELFGVDNDLPVVAATGKQLYTPTPDMLKNGREAATLRAVYILSPRGAEPWRSHPAIIPLSQREAVTALMPNTTGITLRTAPSHATDLARVAALVRIIPVRRVERPNDLQQLEAIAQAILADARQVTASALLPAHHP